MSANPDELPEITVTSTRPTGFSSATRRSRGIVKINGNVVGGWLDWTVDNNEYYAADTFQVNFAVSALPESNNAAWFSQQTEIFVEILAGFPADPANPQPSELTSLIYGRADKIGYDPIRQTLILPGRDLTAVFIDARTFDDYSNKTASQVAEILADKHGIGYTITETTVKVGNYYNLDHMQLQTNRSEWDLLTYLARQEAFVCYVKGNSLYFGPDETESANPYAIQYTPPSASNRSPIVNAQDLNFSRDQTVAKGISVTVMSAGRLNPMQKVSYPVAPKSITPGRSSPFGATTNYYYKLPAGATPAQLLQRAQTIYNQIIQHEMHMTATLPGDGVLSTQGTIKVTGTGTAFDQTYFPKLVTRTMSTDGGYSMRVQAQSVNPNLTQAPPPTDDEGTDTEAADDDTDGS